LALTVGDQIGWYPKVMRHEEYALHT